jgi:ATP-dependent Clp protease adaptor protein ClpS
MSRVATAPSRTPRIESDTDKSTRHAPMYKVLLHNDDVTPFDFVERDVCVGIFHLSKSDAHRVTMEVHHKGIGLVGVFALEQAEWKCEQVRSLARGRGFPLQITFEPA